MKRRAWQMVRAGDLGRLVLSTGELSPRQPGEATVRIQAIGLNFADIFACLGLYSATPQGTFIPGLEFAGIVEMPDDAGLVKAGEKVMGCIRFGGYTELLNTDARALIPLPKGWTMEQGAAFPVQAMTAWCALRELGNLQANQLVLLHSAAGGVGLQALGMIQKLGARAVATVGHADKVALLQEQGLDREAIIVRDAGGFGKQLDAALKHQGRDGFDLILDSVAGPFFHPAYKRLIPFGRQVIFGAANMMPGGKRPGMLKLALQYLRRPKVDPLNMISENRSVMGFNLIWMWHRVDDMRPICAQIQELGNGAPHVGHTFPFEEMPKALRKFQSGTTTGKVVVTVER